MYLWGLGYPVTLLDYRVQLNWAPGEKWRLTLALFCAGDSETLVTGDTVKVWQRSSEKLVWHSTTTGSQGPLGFSLDLKVPQSTWNYLKVCLTLHHDRLPRSLNLFLDLFSLLLLHFWWQAAMMVTGVQWQCGDSCFGVKSCDATPWEACFGVKLWCHTACLTFDHNSLPSSLAFFLLQICSWRGFENLSYYLGLICDGMKWSVTLTISMHCSKNLRASWVLVTLQSISVTTSSWIWPLPSHQHDLRHSTCEIPILPTSLTICSSAS